jgi:hypothetical protein
MSTVHSSEKEFIPLDNDRDDDLRDWVKIAWLSEEYTHIERDRSLIGDEKYRMKRN